MVCMEIQKLDNTNPDNLTEHEQQENRTERAKAMLMILTGKIQTEREKLSLMDTGEVAQHAHEQIKEQTKFVAFLESLMTTLGFYAEAGAYGYDTLGREIEETLAIIEQT